MTNQSNRPDHPLDAELDSALRQMAKEIHPRQAFVAKLRGELESQAAHPRRGFWSLLTRARPWLAQAVLIAALAALVLVAGSLTGRLFVPDGGELREIGANLTPSTARHTSDALPAGALARLGKGKIQSIDTAPDGRIVVGSTAGLCVYNTGLSVDWCRWTDAPVHAALFDPTGTRLAVRYGGKTEVEIWDAAQGQVIASRQFAISTFYTSPNLPNPNFFTANGIAWDPAGNQLAVIETGQGVSAWEWQNDSIAWGPVAVGGEPIGVEWLTGPEGESIVAALTPESLTLIDGGTGQAMSTLSGMAEAAPGSFVTLARAAQGSRIAVGSDDKISVFDIATWNATLYQSIPHPVGRFQDIALSSDGEQLAAQTDQTGSQIITFDLRTGQETGRIPSMLHSPLAWDSAYRLYYGAKFGAVAFWVGGNEILDYTAHTLPPQFAAWVDQSKVVTLADRNIYTWDVSTQLVAMFAEVNLPETMIPSGLSRDGLRALYFDPTASRMIVWDVTQNQTLHDIKVGGFVHAVTLSPDGIHLAAVNEDGQILTWKLLENGAEERDVSGIRDFTSVEALAFDPSGEQIAVAYTKDDGSYALEVHKIASQQKIADLPLDQHLPTTEPISELAWSEDGQYIGASQGLGTVAWDTIAWNRRTWFLPEDEAPQSLRAFAFNGTLGVASANQDIIYHDWSTEARYTFSGHTMMVTDLAFRPDGEALASASNDGTVILWNLGSASLPPVEVLPTATPMQAPQPIITESTVIEPTPTRTPAFDPSTPVQEYTVVDGDTCQRIAYTFNISVESLITFNDLAPDCSNLFIGQKLRIPYPTPTPEAASVVPMPLPNATQRPIPDTTGYDVSQLSGISPSGQWTWMAIRGEWTENAPREDDLNFILVDSVDGPENWVLEEYTPHGLGEGRPTGFTFSADDGYLYFYDSGRPDGCGLPWQAVLRRLDLQSGIVSHVPPTIHLNEYDKYALSPDASRLAVVTHSGIQIYGMDVLQPQQVITLPFIDPVDWTMTDIRWQPTSNSTLLAFEIVSPPEDPCNTPPADQKRWTVVIDTEAETAWNYLNPPNYVLHTWSDFREGVISERLIYQSHDGSELQVDPRSGEVLP